MNRLYKKRKKDVASTSILGFSRLRQLGFTLIELLVVISIIGLLSTLAIIALNNGRIQARDARRKADLQQIKLALDMYYQENGIYPPAGACAYGSTWCFIHSTAGTSWFSAIAPYLAKQPIDPTNNLTLPYIGAHYSYMYGNVTANGQGFDLIGQLENTSDPDRCGLKQYRFQGSLAFGAIMCNSGWSNQVYVPQ